MLQLVGTLHRHIDVSGLFGAELGGLGADLVEVQAGHHLVEVLGQHVDLLVVQRFAATINVVEHALGHRDVDIDCREGQLAALLQLIQTAHTGGGLLGDALDVGLDAGVEARLDGQLGPARLEQSNLFLAAGVVEHRKILLGLGAEDHQTGGIAAIGEVHVGGAAIASLLDAVGEGPVLIRGFAS